MKIGVPKEIKPQENRIGLTPDSVKTLVSYMSHCMSLFPGDICCTGTPPGVGENMNPPRFLKEGDQIRLGIDKLGEQNHKVKHYK